MTFSLKKLKEDGAEERARQREEDENTQRERCELLISGIKDNDELAMLLHVINVRLYGEDYDARELDPYDD